MQTVYESIVIWLNTILTDPDNGFPSTHIVIDMQTIPNWQDFQNAGLLSSPNDIRTEMIGGQRKCQEFKSFYLRIPYNEFQSRLQYEEYFEKLEKCIYKNVMDGIKIDDDREWVSISVNAGIYMAQKDDVNRHADYLVPLKLVYIE